MRTIVLTIIFSLACCINCQAQAKAVKKIIKKTTLRSTRRAAFEAAKKRTYEELVKDGIKHTGGKYTGRALGEQIVKRAAREKVIALMEKEGVESFLQYGNKKAAKSLADKGMSGSKKAMYDSSTKMYSLRLAELRKAANTGSNKIARTFTRILVSARNQFITRDAYLKFISKHPELIKKTGVKDAKVLRDNMLAVMGKYGKYAKNTLKNANQAHHIVGNKTPIAAAKLKKYGIDINDPMNGIFLPSNNRSGLKGTIHRGGHTDDYYHYIEREFATCKSKEQCYEVLDKLKADLYKGKIKLYSDEKHKVNKIF